jgi:hypothetical protein
MATAALPPLSAQPPMANPTSTTAPPSLVSVVPGLYLDHRRVPASASTTTEEKQPPTNAVNGTGAGAGAGTGTGGAAGSGGVQRRWGRRGVVG